MAQFSELFEISRRLTVEEMCESVGRVLAVEGQPNLEINSVAPLDGGDENALTFCRFTGEQAQVAISKSDCGVIVCTMEVSAIQGKTLIRVTDPRGWFIDALNILNPLIEETSIHKTAVVSIDAVLGADVEIGAHAVIEAGAVIGSGCRIGAFCFVGEAATLGDRVVLQPHCAVGTSGLSFHERPDGDHVLFQHMGRAIVGQGTIIGTHSTVVRGILKHTWIGSKCEIGNYVNIGHNCAIGQGVFISSSTVLAGGAKIGAWTRIAAGVTVSSHCSVGMNARIGIGSVIIKDIPDGKRMFGNPARALPTMREF